MIRNNAIESLNMLNSFFKNELSIIDIPELVRIDSPNGLWNGLVFLNSQLTTLNLENMEQAPYIINCENLQNVNLNKLQEVEFSPDGNGIYLNNLEYFPTKFLQNSKIQSLSLPSFKGTQNPLPVGTDDINNNYSANASFWNNYWLRDVSLGNSLMREENNSNYKFNGFWFRNNYFLKFLKLNYPYKIPLVRTAGFNTTPIGSGSGYIYVPDDLVTAYQADTNWHAFAGKIKKMSDYESDFNAYTDSITDSWTDIIENCNTGHAERYPIGGTKTVKINNVPTQFRIVGKGVDPLADNSGYAALTWMETTITRFTPISIRDTFDSNNPRQFNNAINFRSILTEIYNGIESTVKAGIKTVIKQSIGRDNGNAPGSFPSVESGVWPPSQLELGLDTNASPYPYYDVLPRRVINYYLGETNINNISGQKIRVALRDYSGASSSYPDVLRPNDNSSYSMDVIDSDNSNAYIVIGFCT